MKKSASGGRKGRLNTKTFAVRDDKGNIYVTVPVLLYKKRDPGYEEIAKYFTEMTTDSAVALSDWCVIDPLNSSTNELTGDDDDDK